MPYYDPHFKVVPAGPEWYTPRDAARLLEVQVRTVKHWCEQGDDRMKNAQRVDGGWQVSRDDLLLILAPKKSSRT